VCLAQRTVQETQRVEQGHLFAMEGREQGSTSRGSRERAVCVSAHAIDYHQKHSTRGSGYRHPVLVFCAMAYVAELRELHERAILLLNDDGPERPRTGYKTDGVCYARSMTQPLKTPVSALRSMTGFARREAALPAGTLIWEVRTVNHRYLEVSLRLPEDFRALEAEVRATIAGQVRRGKLDATLHYRSATPTTATLEVNEPLLEVLIERTRDIAQRTGGTVNAVDVLRWPGVVREPERDGTPLQAAAQTLLKEALQALAAHRDSEGARTAAMLAERCDKLLELVTEVGSRIPEICERIRTKLHERLTQFAATETNRERFEQELVLALQKLDVDEELDRLRSHVTEVRKALAGNEPAGRRLDFLMQEFNREANTLGSKSQDPATTRAAVDMKVLIEQMREQVQNVE